MPRFPYRGCRPAVLAAALALGWLAGACTPGPAAAPVTTPRAPAAPELPAVAAKESPGPDSCAFRAPGAERPDTVRAVVGGAFPARQLYQTLVRVDCSGRLRGVVATSWASADGGRTWMLSLGDSRFWDGSPVTAEMIASGWARDSATAAALRDAGIVFVGAESDRELSLVLSAPRDSLPQGLADQRLSVMRRAGDAPWPVGTGPYRLPESDPAPATLEPVMSGRPVRVLPAPRDTRDAIDAGADIVVTDEPATLAYAAERPGLTSLALPWTRTYGLVLTAPDDSAAAAVTPAFKEALARDAVRIDARPAASSRCPASPPASAGRVPRPGARIAYPAGDRTAADLAARLAALGMAGARVAVSLDSAVLAASLRERRETAYVVPIPHSCDAASWPPGVAVLPVVETRAHAVVRNGAPPLTVDRDGVLRLLPETP